MKTTTSEEKEIKKEQKTVNLIISKTEKISEISNVEELKEADEYRIKIKEKLLKIEEDRKSYTKPLNDTVAKINANYKKLTEPLKEEKDRIEQMILNYRRIEEAKRLEEENILKEASGNLNITVTNSVPDIIETKYGTTTITKKWTYLVEDLKKVPRQYLMIDDYAVKDAIRNGVRKIKGLNILQDESLRFTKKEE